MKHRSSADDEGAVVEAAALLGLELPTAAPAKLAELAGMLARDGVRLGLVAPADGTRVLERHVLDSLRAAAAAIERDRLAMDIGSGAGLPGLVMAIALPRLRVQLVEPRRRAVAFLELAVERLETPNAGVTPGRVEDVAPVAADLATARAFAPVERSWAAAEPLLRHGGRLAYFAGRGWKEPDALSGAVSLRRVDSVLIDSSGPLVIITRQ